MNQAVTVTYHAEVIAMAIKGVLILQSLGRKAAIGYLKKRGFTPEETVNILLRRRTRFVDGTHNVLPRRASC